MEFVFTEEQDMIRETAQAFFADNANSVRTRKAMAKDGFDRDLWRDFCQELGLAGASMPEQYGGAQLGQIEFAILAEAAGAQVAALPMLGFTMAANGILAGGHAAQKDKFLPPMIGGDLIAVYGEADSLAVTNETLSGSVEFIPHGGVADVFVVSTPERTWIVEASAGGVSVQSHMTMDQTRPLATLTLDCAKAEPLQDSDAARAAAQAAGWLCLASESLGGAQACLDRTLDYSLERVQFGRQIGSFQAYKHRLADMVVEIEQLRSGVYWAAASIDEQADNVKLALHSAKSFGAQTYHFCAGNMIQLHGGIGFTWEHDAHLYFKRARSIGTMFGDSVWHNEQIAALVLGAAA